MAAKEDTDAVQAMWDDLARQARSVHCPEHFVEPWRVHVIGTSPHLKLDISGCCPKIGKAVNEMIAADPKFRATR